jgi:hypothetical protein
VVSHYPILSANPILHIIYEPSRPCILSCFSVPFLKWNLILVFAVYSVILCTAFLESFQYSSNSYHQTYRYHADHHLYSHYGYCSICTKNSRLFRATGLIFALYGYGKSIMNSTREPRRVADCIPRIQIIFFCFVLGLRNWALSWKRSLLSGVLSLVLFLCAP